jgi:hypothetical protein
MKAEVRHRLHSMNVKTLGGICSIIFLNEILKSCAAKALLVDKLMTAPETKRLCCLQQRSTSTALKIAQNLKP